MHAQGVWKHSTAWLGSFGRRWAARAPAARRARGAQAAADTAVRELELAVGQPFLLLHSNQMLGIIVLRASSARVVRGGLERSQALLKPSRRRLL